MTRQRVTAADRAALDEWIKQLAQIGDGLTLDDFRLQTIIATTRAENRVRRILYYTGGAFMLILLAELIDAPKLNDFGMLWCGAWAISLGGLGAVASVFVTVLKLNPQDVPQKPEQLEVVGRIFLGCLFSLVFALVVIPSELRGFLSFIVSDSRNPPAGGVKLLLPFLCGYSIPLVLGLLGKAIQAVELTLGFDGRGGTPRARRVRRQSGAV
jgi:hypothetical protein